MEKIEFGGAGEVPPAEVKCPMDEFENHMRAIGIVCACEWFGHDRDSAFTADTIRTLKERSNAKLSGAVGCALE